MAARVGESEFKLVSDNYQRITGTQQQMIAAAPVEQRAFLTAQFKLQNEMELTQHITNMLKSESRMAIFRNI